jgi:hypothetical protein
MEEYVFSFHCTRPTHTQDGAGRLGRLLFARWGRQLDCELKQFRLVGDLLMESGAALELSTIFMPKVGCKTLACHTQRSPVLRVQLKG